MIEKNEVIRYKLDDILYIETFEKMWERLNELYHSGTMDGKEFIELSNHNVKIFDSKSGFVKLNIVYRENRNDWNKVTMSGRVLTCTSDQLFEVHRLETKRADQLRFDTENHHWGDSITFSDYNMMTYNEGTEDYDAMEAAYFLGYMLVNGEIEYNKVKINISNGCDRFKMYNSYRHLFDKRECIADYETINYGSDKILTLSGLGFEGVEKLNELFENTEASKRRIPHMILTGDHIVRMSFRQALIDANATVYDVDDPSGDTWFNRQWAELKFDSKEIALQVAELLSIDNEEYFYYEETIDGHTKYCLFTMISYVAYTNVRENGKEIVKGDYDKFNVHITGREGSVTNVEKLDIEDYGYGAITESKRMTVSGVYMRDNSKEDE